MYSQLRQLNLQRAETDELVAILAFGRQMVSTFGSFSIPAPEWLTDNITALEREVRSRHQDMLENRLREIRSRRETLRTAEEKRAAIDREEAELLAALGKKE